MVPFMVFKYNGLFSVTPTDSHKKTIVHISYTETLLLFFDDIQQFKEYILNLTNLTKGHAELKTGYFH